MAMINFQKSVKVLNEVFSENLSVSLLAEEVAACSINDDASTVKDKLVRLDYDYYGVHKDGEIIGYVAQKELENGPISQNYHEFKLGEIVSDSTSIMELLKILKDTHPVFVLENNLVKKIITVADLQKQPIRMFVFGLISLLEMNLLELIVEYYKGEEWKTCLNEKRLANAREIYNKRKDRNEGLDLIQCLQLSDKGEIICRTPELLKRLNFESKKQVKKYFRAIENLRNNTAHSQEYMYENFNDFLDCINQTEEILDSLNQ